LLFLLSFFFFLPLSSFLMPPIVYGIYGSPCTQSVLFAAAEANIPVELVEINFSTGEHKKEPHLSRQPFGKVPAFKDGSLEFYESRAIARYLIDKYGKDSGLIPSTPEERAIMEQWCSLEATTYTPELAQICLHRLWATYKGLEINPEAAQKALSNLGTGLAVMNKRLGESEFLAGNHITLADTCSASYWNLVVTTPEGKEILANYPNIRKWWENLSSRPAWKAVLSHLKH